MFPFMTCAMGGPSLPPNLKNTLQPVTRPLLLTATSVTWLLGTKLAAVLWPDSDHWEKTYFPLFLQSMAPDTFLPGGAVSSFHQDLTTFSGLRRFSLFLCYFDKSVDLCFCGFSKIQFRTKSVRSPEHWTFIAQPLKKIFYFKNLGVILVNKIFVKCVVL